MMMDPNYSIEEEAELMLGEIDAADAMRPETATKEQSIEFLETIAAGIEDRILSLR